MQFTKMAEGKKGKKDEWKYPAIEAYDSGHLSVSEHPPHHMHWAEYGNPKGEPVIFIHGGPGGGSHAKYARFFNPNRYRVLMFDQRGCGESIPHVKDDLKGAMDGNITANLVEDIEKLRAARGITGKAHVFGGSWGSTLAMAYAQAHPENVQDLILRGIFLCDQRDLAYLYQGNAATYHQSPDNITKPGTYRAYRTTGAYGGIPTHLTDERMAAAYHQAWHDYVTAIPVEERGDMIAAYHRRLNSPEFTAEQKLEAAKTWSVWEGVTSYLNHDVSKEALAQYYDPKFATAFATIENEYFYRARRGEDHTLAELTSPMNIAKLAKIPVHIVQGEHDQVCTRDSARSLKKSLEDAGAEQLCYQETEAGHAMTERTTNVTLTAIMETLPRQWSHLASGTPGQKTYSPGM